MFYKFSDNHKSDMDSAPFVWLNIQNSYIIPLSKLNIIYVAEAAVYIQSIERVSHRCLPQIGWH